MSKAEFMKYLQHEIDKAGSQKELANRLKVSQQYINDVLRDRREPGDKILRPLGLRRVVSYERLK